MVMTNRHLWKDVEKDSFQVSITPQSESQAETSACEISPENRFGPLLVRCNTLEAFDMLK